MKNRKFALVIISLILGLSLFVGTKTFALEVPSKPSSGYILDDANILSEQEELSLNSQIQSLKDESSNEIGIYTSADLEGEDPAQFSVQVGRAWGIGTKDYNNGVVIIVSLTNPKRIFIGTGTGLEGALPDALAGQISRDEIAPKFKENKFFDGLATGVSAITQATKGEYQAKEKSSNGITGDLVITGIIFAAIIIQVLLSLMASSKSWWLGGVLGLFFSVVIGAITTSLIVLVVLVLILTPLGLTLDYFLSKNYKKHKERKKKDSTYIMPWYFGSGGSGHSGFGGGGFSGGGFSGGGGFGGGGGGSSW